MIKEVLKDPTVQTENVYNIDKIRMMLFMLSSVKALVPKDNQRKYKSACIKRTIVTAIECINADGRYFKLTII